jgi:DNA-binding IclR family transcriptional regulator
MEILELFDQVRRPLSLKEVCDRLGLAPSSGIGLLKSLLFVGYLEYDKASRTYLPTMKIALLGSWVSEGMFSRMNIVPIMEHMRDVSGETVFLGTRSDLYTQYVHVLTSTEENPYIIPPGTIRPLARTGIGHLFLSLLNDRDLEYTVRRLNLSEPDRSLRVPYEEVYRSVATIRTQGYVFSKNLFHANGGIIAVLLPVAPFNRTLALGLGGTTNRLEANLEDNLRILREARDAVGRFAATAADASVGPTSHGEPPTAPATSR